jgi:hypothetical protein
MLPAARIERKSDHRRDQQEDQNIRPQGYRHGRFSSLNK